MYRLLAVVALASVSSWAMGQDVPDQVGADRPTILDNPLDFSSAPVLPKIEAPTESQIRESMERGIQFLIRDQNPKSTVF